MDDGSIIFFSGMVFLKKADTYLAELIHVVLPEA
jgi:hypothetical protein